MATKVFPIYYSFTAMCKKKEEIMNHFSKIFPPINSEDLGAR